MIFCAESTLLVCKKDSFPQPQIPVPDGKPVTAPVPKSQGTHYPSFSSQFIIRMHYETELLYMFHSFVCLDFIYLLSQSQHYFPKMVF